MSSIKNTCLLYRPALSVWTARKLDKAQSAKVTADAGAIDRTANVHKQLLPECAELEAIQSWAGAFRNWVYLSTSPWDDSGWRIGSVARHMDFMQEVGDRIMHGEVLVDAFVNVYLRAVADAQFKLGGMFNASDYPTERQVRERFRFAVDVMPLPAVDDFRTVEGVDQAEVDRLVGEAGRAVEARIGEAMADAHDKLFKVIEKYARTLEQFDSKEIKRFGDTLVGNVGDLLDVMPALNLTGDPRLTELTNKARELMAFSLVDLRKDDRARRAAIGVAKALVAEFNGGAPAESLGADVSPPAQCKPVSTGKPAKAKELRSGNFADVAARVAAMQSGATPAQSHWPYPVGGDTLSMDRPTPAPADTPRSMFADML